MLVSNRVRRGFSLTEVIVALFIMALGIISLLTLFPLGAVQMGKALRDDRSQTTAVLADGKMRMLWLGQLDGTYALQAFYTTLDTGPAGLGLPTRQNQAGPSYPVLFDPVGFTTYSAPKRDRVAGASSIARHTSTSVPTTPTVVDGAANYASMPDDLTFGAAATPEPGDTTGLLVRQGRFNFAVMLQRPNNADPTRTSLKVMVFDRRIPGIAVSNETACPAINVSVGTTQLTFATAGLNLRSGSWIMDGTIDVANGIRNANFYRVLSVEEVAGTTVVDLETPIVKPSGEFTGVTYSANFFIFQELIDVYERPQIVPGGYAPAQP